MARPSNVYSIVPTITDAAVIAAGNRIDQLTLGQVGVFDYDTGLSIDSSGVSTVRNFFVAVAVDRNGDGTVDDYIKTAGKAIQKRNVESYKVRCYTAAQSQIIDLQNFKADCETEYGIKIEFHSSEKFQNYGYNQLTKTFLVRTGCCEKCATCPTGNCGDLINLLLTDINNDEDNLVIASAVVNQGSVQVTTAPTTNGDATVVIGSESITVALLAADTAITASAKIAEAINTNSTTAYATSDGVDTAQIYLLTTDAGASATTITYAAGSTGSVATTVNTSVQTISNFDTFLESNPEFAACPALRLTSNPDGIKTYCSVNTEYYSVRDPNLIVSLIEGFTCNGTINATQDHIYEEGLGYDYAELEHFADGNAGNPGPYRTGDMIGVAFRKAASVITNGQKYNAIDLAYTQDSIGGFLEYNDQLWTTIIIPCGHDTTGSSLTTILDALLPAYDPKANDIAACTSCDTTNTTSSKAANVDGL